MTVENIIKEIEALSDDEREQLENHLAQIEEAKWGRDAAEARRIARDEGIDQAQIDRTIERLRYP